MNHCCCSEPAASARPSQRCPHDQSQGKPVKLITLKSLLMPQALERLNSQSSYRFCSSVSCPIVYFSAEGDTFATDDLKVPVFPKNLGQEVPICYCFGWTRQRIQQYLEPNGFEPGGQNLVIAAITAHIRARRCGCEVNNPQGSCCLRNISNYIFENCHTSTMVLSNDEA